MKRNSSKTKRKTGGFTLVELVVVIAVLAILAGVGVVAYNGYITYAQKGVDRQTVGEIMHAAELANYDDPSLFKNGATIFLTSNSGLKSTEAVETALGRALGDLTTVKLKYDGWEKPNVANPNTIITALKDPSGDYKGAVGDYLEALDGGANATSYVGHANELWDQVTMYINGMNESVDDDDPYKNGYLNRAVTYANDCSTGIKRVWTEGMDVADPSSPLSGQPRMAVRLARNNAFAFYAQTHPSYNAATMKSALDQCKTDVTCCYCTADYLKGEEWMQIKADYLTDQAAQDANAYLGIMQAAGEVGTAIGKTGDNELLAAMSGYTDLVDSVLAGTDPANLSTLVTAVGENATLSIGVYQGKNGDLRFTFSDDEINPRKEGSTESAGGEVAGTECNKSHTPTVTAVYDGSNVTLKENVESIELCSILEDYKSCTISPSTSYFTDLSISIVFGDDVISVDGGTITALKGGTAKIKVSCTLKSTFTDIGRTADPIEITVNVHPGA